MGQTMRAAVYRRQGEIEVTDVARPRRDGDDECVVEIERCGICGTDLHLVLDGWGRPDSIGGHEWAGTVVDAGDPELVGRAVVGGPDRACGACRLCRAGRSNLCRNRDQPGVAPRQGAFAEVVVRPRAELIAVPDDLDLHRAALAEPLAVALHAITQGALTSEARPMVFGAGPIGAAIVAVLVSRGLRPRVVEPAAKRATLATALGADVLEPSDLDDTAMPMDVVDDPADVVFECSGRDTAMQAGLGQLDRGGRLVLVGTGMTPPRFDPNRILLNELEITGAFNYDDGGFEQALALLAAPSFPADRLIEPEPVPLDDILDAMHRLAGGETTGKVMVQP
ncbi:MAG: alcohol dehydrogenase catalytic domain-containing protein [Acidimicrobiia bacterium]|nr:alcohol dehydrogenase catalytic domain-containing protein [Acidimicrobiia bacterium]